MQRGNAGICRSGLMNEVDILKQEIYEMQKQLQHAFMRIKELAEQVYELKKGTVVEDTRQLEMKF